MIVAVPALVAVGIVLTVWRQPEIYRAQAQIRVEMEQPDVVIHPQLLLRTPFDAQRFYRTQHQIIQSSPVIKPVVEKLRLEERWFPGIPSAARAAVSRLRDNLRVISLEGSTIITISYEDPDPELAAMVANEVVESFIQQRREARAAFLDEVIENMRRQLILNRRKLDESQAALRGFKIKEGLTFIYDTPLDEKRLADLNEVFIKAKTARIAREVQLTELEKLPAERRISALVLMTDNYHFQELRARLDRNEIELATLQEKFLPGHPEIREISAAVERTRKQLNELAEGMLTGLRTEYEKALQEERMLAEVLGEIQLEDQLKEESRAEYFDLKRQIEVDQEVMLSTRKRMEEAMVGESIPKVRIELVEPALVPAIAVKPRKMFSLMLGGALGLVGGIVLAFFLAYTHQRLASVEEVEQYLGLPVLSLIPRQSEAVSIFSQDASTVEAYRLLRTKVDHLRRQEAFRTLMITSAVSGEGKSTISSNLAVCMADFGDQAILIDGDCRRPSINRLLELDNEAGLIDVLAGTRELKDVIRKAGREKTFPVITSGGDTEMGIPLLNSQPLVEFIGKIEGEYELSIFDSPQVLGVSDTLFLASAVDAVLLVVEHNRHPRSLIMQAQKQLTEAGARIIGVVFNKISPDQIAHYRHYSYLLGDGS